MKKIKLQLFAEGAETGGTEDTQDAAVNGRNTTEVVYGKQDDAAEPDTEEKPAGEEPEEQKRDFNDLIKEEYKDDFDRVLNERMQKVINRKFAETKSLKERNASLNPLLQLVSEKYGTKADDIEGIIKALENDNSLYEQEAISKGMSVEQLKAIKGVERENERLKAAVEQHRQSEEAEKVYAGWIEQGEDLKNIYPNFDFRTEVANNDFAGLLRNGIDVKTAYEVIHKDEILGGAMAATAQTIGAKIANNIKANGSRPAENGTGTQKTAAIVKSDPSKWTKDDMEEVIRRVARGEKIVL